MISQQSSIFPKQIKIDDYASYQEGNVLCILESSNLLLGTGARTSHTAIVLAKSLHYLTQQGTMHLNNKNILELGCGVGFLGIYLASLGNKVILSDLSSMKDLVERNIGLNKSLLKGKAQFIIANWRIVNCTNKCLQLNEGNSTTSSEKSECLTHLIDSIDYTICCQSGGLSQLQCQLKFMGKQGLIFAFMQKSMHYNEDNEDYLTCRIVEQYLIEREIKYEKIDQYHPDYTDQRIGMFHIWK